MKIRSIEGTYWALFAMLSIGAGLACQGNVPPESAEVEIESAESVFEPPADGRLTDDQVRGHAASASLPANVDREELLAALEKRAGDGGRAAGRPGSDTNESQWVRARVMEARLPDDVRLGDVALRVSTASLEATLQERTETSDPDERARLAAQVAALEAVRAANEARSREEAERSARTHNRELLARYAEVEGPPEASR